jgi:hypothetical protein
MQLLCEIDLHWYCMPQTLFAVSYKTDIMDKACTSIEKGIQNSDRATAPHRSQGSRTAEFAAFGMLACLQQLLHTRPPSAGGRL